jgi:hypothetical protein
MEAVLVQPRSSTVPTPTPSTRNRVGLAAQGLTVSFLLFDSSIKLAKASFVMEATRRIGYPEATVQPIGLILLACVVLYVAPRTAVLGAVLLTGYLGGAVATHLRLGDPLLSQTLFPIYVGVLAWTGLYLRDARLRAFNPLASQGDLLR